MKLNFRTRKDFPNHLPHFIGKGAKAQTGNCPDPCPIANLGSMGSKVRMRIQASDAKANSFPATLTSVGGFNLIVK